MEEKKYELLMDDTINIYRNCYRRTLYRIRALRDFGIVKKGDLGGYIEKESNLSHYGNCWISGNAKVYDNAKVLGNAQVLFDAQVYENAEVCGDARLYGAAQVYGNAWVYGNAVLTYDTHVFGNAQVCWHASVCGKAKVYGNAWVFGHATIYDNAQVYGDTKIDEWICRINKNANISSNNDYVIIKGIWTENIRATFFKCKDEHINVKCGCFSGALEEFERKVKEEHGDSKYGKEYLSIINTIKIHFEL